MTAQPVAHGGATAEIDNPAKGGKSRGRVAGQDPAKRRQIIKAAQRCFMELGFEAASMNDITTAAGVSKGTLYVYFADKEDLFTSICRAERSEVAEFARQQMDASASTREALIRFCTVLATRLLSDHVIKAQRMVLGVAERMPQLSANFFGPEPFAGLIILSNYLQARTQAGELFVDDLELASRQLLDLSMAGFFKRRLFGNMPEAPTTEELARTVERGVDLFLAYYGVPH